MQAADAAAALRRAAARFAAAERAATSDEVILGCADEVLRCRLLLYGLLERLGMRPDTDRDPQLARDLELLRHFGGRITISLGRTTIA